MEYKIKTMTPFLIITYFDSSRWDQPQVQKLIFFHFTEFPLAKQVSQLQLPWIDWILSHKKFFF